MTESASRGYTNEADWLARYDNVIDTRHRQHSPHARALPALLVTLDWFGSPRTLTSWLPEGDEPFDATTLLALLGGIGFRCQQVKSTRQHAVHSLLPGAIATGEDYCNIWLGHMDGSDWWHTEQGITDQWQPDNNTLLYRVQPDPGFVSANAPQPHWVQRLLVKARKEVTGIAGISLVINLLALSISMFTMVVYNHIIPTGATTTLIAVSLAAGMAIFGGWFLRVGRARVMARMSAWAGAKISTSAVSKTLGLPVELSARQGVYAHLTRMRSMENVRQYLGGSAGAALVDYPFVVIFLFVIALLGGWIVFVPLVGLATFLVAGRIFRTIMTDRSMNAGRASNRLQQEFLSLVHRQRSIRGSSNGRVWSKRFAMLAMQSAKANQDMARWQAAMQAVSHAIGMITVLTTMATGVVLVLDGLMSTGGLIAAMMLIWRVTTPAQQLFNTSLQLSQIRDSIGQLDQLMASAGEMTSPQLSSPLQLLPADISTDRLFYRYNMDQDPALNGISIAVTAGEMVAVIGPNGAGKSTLLQCLAGIRAAQSGHVFLAGKDIRQFDPADYRSWCGYHAHSGELLPVALRELFLLGSPGKSDAAICDALAQAGGEQWWRFFGMDDAVSALDLPLDAWNEQPRNRRQRYILSMAKAVLDQPPLLLLDDPFTGGDPILEKQLQQLLSALKGSTTVLIATHQPAVIEQADKVLILDRGNQVHFGPVNPEGAEAQAAPAPNNDKGQIA